MGTDNELIRQEKRFKFIEEQWTYKLLLPPYQFSIYELNRQLQKKIFLKSKC